ncbi:MAG: polyprenyl synthetase family protein [Microcoleus sp. PH2017_10_PVI_O_A]|uniref:geranylgeranyl diphosphate synthase CrtE n=1 Tax=unclassified Microcoleus TaxID=2642155 RepID=UPI001D69335D|nr:MULTISPECIES: farnesyl diphosphate synthase [unclassified Microcoleus]TAE84113.1 MAG: polyprenyl synthetase family protein [Oscillatoriales cyanobacterium]MCC3405664.1 polyprenyl synthetase family protein [Microcoleus sp. PH2017_10_PVI_O_A]MCC3459569.1 polyprenyl synthetase family protein [Microcoleus sp. PH2017_11_PCY_U_A]MCC3478129.1 polyprenyl synthetase family protein [Microcoleus sp. PH2017_12_PCY_D_A]MCC3528120.1 polyprenyl synthetase family protein [Microcoleus sp. PH2017_21_RUC_O_A]
MVFAATEMDSSQPESAFDLSTYLVEQKKAIEVALDSAIQVIYPEKIYEAMRYSLLAGGKRLRPILCLAGCEIAGGTSQMAMPTACALEMIHTMSLIHDDLPAMDNDDYRRGKLTNHKVYGEDIAILAGDGLLSYAFEFIATQTQNVPPQQVLQTIAHLARASGAPGLVGGQVLDLESEGLKDVSIETLTYIHAHKTGALLEACVVCGAILAGASAADLQRLSRFAKNIGLAFQIIDDILDITATAEELGKTAGKDVQAGKVTYPSLWGIEESRRQAKQLVADAKAQLTVFGNKAQPLLAIADFITSRSN